MHRNIKPDNSESVARFFAKISPRGALGSALGAFSIFFEPLLGASWARSWLIWGPPAAPWGVFPTSWGGLEASWTVGNAFKRKMKNACFTMVKQAFSRFCWCLWGSWERLGWHWKASEAYRGKVVTSRGVVLPLSTVWVVPRTLENRHITLIIIVLGCAGNVVRRSWDSRHRGKGLEEDPGRVPPSFAV